MIIVPRQVGIAAFPAETEFEHARGVFYITNHSVAHHLAEIASQAGMHLEGPGLPCTISEYVHVLPDMVIRCPRCLTGQRHAKPPDQNQLPIVMALCQECKIAWITIPVAAKHLDGLRPWCVTLESVGGIPVDARPELGVYRGQTDDG